MILLKILFVLLIFIPVFLLAVTLTLELLRKIPKDDEDIAIYERRVKLAKEKISDKEKLVKEKSLSFGGKLKDSTFNKVSRQRNKNKIKRKTH